jgi:hypothetical protein
MIPRSTDACRPVAGAILTEHHSHKRAIITPLHPHTGDRIAVQAPGRRWIGRAARRSRGTSRYSHSHGTERPALVGA